MWDETLIESRGINGQHKKWFTVPLSIFAHALVVGIVIGSAYWSIGAVPAPVAPPIKGVSVFLKSKDPGGGSSIQRANHPAVNKSAPRSAQPITPPAVVPVPESSNFNLNDAAPSTNTLVGGGDPQPGTEENGDGTGPGSSGAGLGVSSGGDDQPVIMRPEIREPVLIKKVEPVYPRLAILGRIQGIVVLEAVISKSGRVEGVRVLSAPNKLLSDPAVAAVQQWIYKPAIFNNRPIAVYFRVTVNFYLK